MKRVAICDLNEYGHLGLPLAAHDIATMVGCTIPQVRYVLAAEREKMST